MPRLDIRLAEGRGFPKDGSNKPDPYVTLQLGEQKEKTHTDAKTTNPRWQQVFKMKFEEDSQDKLLLETFNKNFFSDDKIGHYSIPIQQLISECRAAPHGLVDRWVKLQECITLGELHLRLSIEGLKGVGVGGPVTGSPVAQQPPPPPPLQQPQQPNQWFAIPEAELRIDQQAAPRMDLGRSVTYSCTHPIANGAPCTIKRYRAPIPATPEVFAALDHMRKASQHPSILYCFGPVRAAGGDQQQLCGVLLGEVHSTFQEWILRSGVASTELIVRGLQSVAVGVAQMHSLGITHGNLKTSKFVVQVPPGAVDKPNVMLSAYGPSRLTNRVEQTLYSAPEDTGARPVPPACDVYSFAISCWMLLHGPEHDFVKGLSYEQQQQKWLRAQERPKFNKEKLGVELPALLERCWNPNPGQRPAMREVVTALSTIADSFGQAAAVNPQLRCYVFAVERDPTIAMNWMNLGRGLAGDEASAPSASSGTSEIPSVLCCGETHTQKSALTRAVECDSKNPACWIALAGTLSASAKEKATVQGQPRSRRDCFIKAILCDETESFPWTQLALDLGDASADWYKETVYIRPGLEDLSKIDCVRQALGCDPESSAARTLLAQFKRKRKGHGQFLDKFKDEKGASKKWLELVSASFEEDLQAAISSDPDNGDAWCELASEVGLFGQGEDHMIQVAGKRYLPVEMAAKAVSLLDSPDPLTEVSTKAATCWSTLAQLVVDDDTAEGARDWRHEKAGYSVAICCKRALEQLHLCEAARHVVICQMALASSRKELSQSAEGGTNNKNNEVLRIPVLNTWGSKGNVITWGPETKEYSTRAQLLSLLIQLLPGCSRAHSSTSPMVASFYQMLLREKDDSIFEQLDVGEGKKLSRGNILWLISKMAEEGSKEEGRATLNLVDWLEKENAPGQFIDLLNPESPTVEVRVLDVLATSLMKIRASPSSDPEGKTIAGHLWKKAAQVCEQRLGKLSIDKNTTFTAKECWGECLMCDPRCGEAWKENLDLEKDWGEGIGFVTAESALLRAAVFSETDCDLWHRLWKNLMFRVRTTTTDTALTCDFEPMQGKVISAAKCLENAINTTPKQGGTSSSSLCEFTIHQLKVFAVIAKMNELQSQGVTKGAKLNSIAARQAIKTSRDRPFIEALLNELQPLGDHKEVFESYTYWFALGYGMHLHAAREVQQVRGTGYTMQQCSVRAVMWLQHQKNVLGPDLATLELFAQTLPHDTNAVFPEPAQKGQNAKAKNPKLTIETGDCIETMVDTTQPSQQQIISFLNQYVAPFLAKDQTPGGGLPDQNLKDAELFKGLCQNFWGTWWQTIKASTSFPRSYGYAMEIECSSEAEKVVDNWLSMGESLMTEGGGPNSTKTVTCLGTTFNARACFQHAEKLHPGNPRTQAGLEATETDPAKKLSAAVVRVVAGTADYLALELVGSALRLGKGGLGSRLSNGMGAVECYTKCLSMTTAPGGGIGRQEESWRGLGQLLPPPGAPRDTIEISPYGPVTQKTCFVNALTLDTQGAPSWARLGTMLRPGETVPIGGQPYDSRACFIFGVDFLNTKRDSKEDCAYCWNCLGTFLTSQVQPNQPPPPPMQLRSHPEPVDGRACHLQATRINPDSGYSFGQLAKTFPRGTPGHYDNLVLACGRPDGAAFWLDLANALPQGATSATVGGATIGKTTMLQRGLTADPNSAFGWICLGCTLQPHEYSQECNPRECFIRAVTCQNPDPQGWHYVASTFSSDTEQLDIPGIGMVNKAECLRRVASGGR